MKDASKYIYLSGRDQTSKSVILELCAIGVTNQLFDPPFYLSADNAILN